MGQAINTEEIRRLNDQFRSQRAGGSILLTQGVAGFAEEKVAALLNQVSAFDNFSDDNDPHGEHDFGALEFEGDRIFWKIDYYDQSKTYGSSDPSDSAVTHRVLTVMLAQEY